MHRKSNACSDCSFRCSDKTTVFIPWSMSACFSLWFSITCTSTGSTGIQRQSIAYFFNPCDLCRSSRPDGIYDLVLLVQIIRVDYLVFPFRTSYIFCNSAEYYSRDTEHVLELLGYLILMYGVEEEVIESFKEISGDQLPSLIQDTILR